VTSCIRRVYAIQLHPLCSRDERVKRRAENVIRCAISGFDPSGDGKTESTYSAHVFKIRISEYVENRWVNIHLNSCPIKFHHRVVR
jgi:ribosomal protein L37AE/L43A